MARLSDTVSAAEQSEAAANGSGEADEQARFKPRSGQA
jgi:hypothetical protein